MPRPPRLPARPITFWPNKGRPYQAWCRVIEHRPPKAGEFYLSGAIIEAWETHEGYSQSYWVVEAIFPRVNHHEYPQGEKA